MNHYAEDLAYIHDRAFNRFAEDATREILALFDSGACRIETVIDVGCGAGQSTRILVDAGYRAIGIEPSAALLEFARRRAPEATFLEASAYAVELPACEAVIALGEPLSYHDADAASLLRRFFRSAREVLPEGGLFVFDLIVDGRESLDGRHWMAGDDWAVLVAVIEDRRRHCLTRDITTFRRRRKTYRREHEVHGIRVFDEHEIVAWLVDAGFAAEVTSAYGAVDLLPRRRAFIATATA